MFGAFPGNSAAAAGMFWSFAGFSVASQWVKMDVKHGVNTQRLLITFWVTQFHDTFGQAAPCVLNLRSKWTKETGEGVTGWHFRTTEGT